MKSLKEDELFMWSSILSKKLPKEVAETHLKGMMDFPIPNDYAKQLLDKLEEDL